VTSWLPPDSQSHSTRPLDTCHWRWSAEGAARRAKRRPKVPFKGWKMAPLYLAQGGGFGFRCGALFKTEFRFHFPLPICHSSFPQPLAFLTELLTFGSHLAIGSGPMSSMSASECKGVQVSVCMCVCHCVEVELVIQFSESIVRKALQLGRPFAL